MALSPGNKREVPGSHCLGNATQSRIIKSYWLFLALPRCWELSTEETVLLWLEGELHDDAFPSHAHHGYCHPRAGTRVCPVASEAFEIDCRSSPFTLPHCWQHLPDSPFGMAGQTLLQLLICSSHLLLQPAWPWGSGLPGHKLGSLHYTL